MIQCRHCYTQLNRVDVRARKKERRGWFGIVIKTEFEDECLFECPECGFSFWATWDRWGLCDYREVVSKSDLHRIQDPVALAWATRKSITHQEKMRIWREVDRETPDFTLLSDSERREIIRLTKQHGEAQLATFMMYNHGFPEFHIGKERDFATGLPVNDPDWLTICRKLRAAEGYRDFVKQQFADALFHAVEKKIEATL